MDGGGEGGGQSQRFCFEVTSSLYVKFVSNINESQFVWIQNSSDIEPSNATIGFS